MQMGFAQTLDSITTDVPEAVPLIDISTETEISRQTISRALDRVLEGSEIAAVEDEYDNATREFNQAIADYEKFRSVTPNKLKLNDYIRKWRGLGDARTRWRSSVTSFMARAKISKDALEFEKSKWQLTRQQAVDNNATDPVISTIDNTLERINNALTVVNRQLNLALETSTTIAEQKSEIDEIVDDLVEWSGSGELNTFYQRHEPIWQTELDLFDNSNRTKLSTAGDHADAINAYYRNFGAQVNRYLIITAIIVFLIFFLERRLKAMEFNEVEDSMTKVRDVIDKHTTATAIYFASVFALFYLENLPSLVGVAFMLTVLACSAVLLRSFTSDLYKWVIPMIIVVFILDSLKSYVWYSAAGYRLYMYFEAIFSLSVVVYYLRKFRTDDLRVDTINTIFKIGARLLVPVLIGAIIANTFGYTNLSDVLLRIGIMGPAITVLAYGILFVLGGVIGTGLSLYFADHTEFPEHKSQAILARTQTIVRWVAATIWVLFILVSAELYRPIFNAIELWVTEPWIVGEFSLTPGALLSFILVIVVAFLITKAIALVLEGGVIRFRRIPKGTLAIASMMIRYFIVALAVAVALGTLGVDLGKFGLIASALGVGIGFGLQGIVANFIAGMILTFEQPLSPGDTIEINGQMGVVQKIGVRACMLRSFDGADVVIPNATLLSHDLLNWTRVDDQKRIEINIGAAYGSNPKKVREILLNVVHEHPRVLNRPEPSALFSTFGDSSLDFRLLFWAPVGDWLTIQSEVASEIYDKFAENGIEIPFPQQDVWIRESKSDKSEDSDPSSDDVE